MIEDSQLSLRLLTLGSLGRPLSRMLLHSFADNSLASLSGNSAGQIRPSITEHHDRLAELTRQDHLDDAPHLAEERRLADNHHLRGSEDEISSRVETSVQTTRMRAVTRFAALGYIADSLYAVKMTAA
jgi:hypothetical protein